MHMHSSLPHNPAEGPASRPGVIPPEELLLPRLVVAPSDVAEFRRILEAAIGEPLDVSDVDISGMIHNAVGLFLVLRSVARERAPGQGGSTHDT